METSNPAATELEIDHVGARGDGVAEGPVYLPFTLPGERVQVRFDDGRGEATSVLRPSPDRVTPPCRHFQVCGGCNLQHWRLSAYRRWKRNLVAEQLAREGLDVEVGELIDATASGRRRATFHAVRASAVGFVFGFSEPASNRVFDLKECLVVSPAIRDGIESVRRLAESLLVRAGRVDVQVTETDAGLDVAARGGAKLDGGRRATLAELAMTAGWARLSVGDEVVAVARPPEVEFDGVRVRPRTGTFLQATLDGERALAELVVTGVGKSKAVADLFAGVGTFALRLAKRTPVDAFEGDAGAVATLKDAVKRAEGLKPLSVRRRDLAREPVSVRELKAFDAVVLDPPRAGAREQALQLGKSSVARVVMASCNPATFARDARTLVDGGFRFDSATPVDQFLWSPHVELVGVFSQASKRR